MIADIALRPRRYDDDHYRDVALTYRMRIGAHSKAPARDLARIFQVNITTANRWVKEARRRGVLEPASARGRPAGPRCSCRCPVHCPGETK